ncbi:MAG: Ig-like domain-containing protein [bacterium]
MSKIQKIIAIGTALTTIVWMSGAAYLAPVASAATAAEMQASIDALMAELAVLQGQLAALEGTPAPATTTTYTGIPANFTFTKLLKRGSKGDEAKYLQIILQVEVGEAVVGTADGIFGKMTDAAVKQFQSKNSLVADGIVGKNTRAKLNALLAAAPVTKELTVASVSPTSNATSVVVSSNIIVTLSMALDSATVTADSVKLTADAVAVATTTTVSDKVITIDPTADLAENTTYTVALTTAVKATDGTALKAAYSSSFSTGETVTPPPVTGDELRIKLASDTPGVASVATGGNANFTKLILTAGPQDVEISKIKITQSGQSTSSDIQNIKVVDENGVSLGTTGSLDTNNKSTISFSSPKLKVSANTSKTVYLRAGVPSSGATAGRTIALGIASIDDVTATSLVVVESGTGNLMSILSLTIGTVTVDQDAATSDASPDVGSKNVVLNRFKISANSTENITIENIEALEVGTASLDDVENIELYSITKGASLAEVASWSAQGKVSFTGLNLAILKGETHRFEIRADVIDGTGLTINADVIDGTDVLVVSKGDKYGYYITATDGGNWSNSNAGRGSSDQTISTGAVIVSRSASSVAVGNIAQADNQALATFELDVRGEPVRITSLRIGFVGGTSNAELTTDTQISNVRIVDVTNNETHGPYDVSITDVTANGTTYGATVTTTDLIMLPVGVHKFTVNAKIATTTSNSDTVYVGFPDPDADLTIKGETSNNTITASPAASNVNGNTQTVQAAALSAVTSAIDPAAHSVAKGAQNVKLFVATLDAQGSGEDITVSQVIIEDTMDLATSNGDDWTGLELWADLTSESSTRGDIYETRVAIASSSEPNDSGATDETVAMTLSPTIRVKKNSFVEIAAFANLKSGATADDTHQWSLDQVSGGVTATGVDTGTAVSAITPTGAGQILTITASGVVVAAVDASQPSSQLLAENTMKATVAVFRLSATDGIESHDLTNFKITNTGSATAVSKYYFYASARSDAVDPSEPIASATGAATVEISGLSGVVTIPASGYVLITVKADAPDVNNSSASDGDTIIVTVATTAGEIDTVGLSSGAGTDPTIASALTPNTHYLYEAYPMFALNSASPSGDLNPATLEKVAIFDVTAVGGNDITFDGNDSNTLTLAISATAADNTANDAFELRTKEGTVLASPAVINLATNGTSTVVFTFEDSVFTVPKGQTKELHVFADLDGLTAAGNFIQVKLDDVTTYISFSINSGTTNASRGDIIFRGEIKANRLQRNINS